MTNRANSEEMAAAAATSGTTTSPETNPYPQSKMKSTLIDNAQPMSFTGLPTYDSNV